MALALGTAAIVLLALLSELTRPRAVERFARARLRWRTRSRGTEQIGYDPGRERRAEQRARALLRSCVNDEEWSMYRDLGFLRVWGGSDRRAGGHAATGASLDLVGEAENAEPSPAADRITTDAGAGEASYAYLIYPHKPIVAYLPQTGVLLSEYCVAFPDLTRPYGSARLPDSDDVLAKWMALTADERRLIADANMHLPGRQIDPDRIRRDLLRLARWERERLYHDGRGASGADSLRAA
ncbi:MAG TPA: hypothetical protein VGG98_10360 [Solirubrobacteraceae bacterium]|jgi:hypothetical protein